MRPSKALVGAAIKIESGASDDVGTKLRLRPSERPTRIQKPRLARGDYVGKRTCHVTLPTSQRSPVFEDLDLAGSFEAVLLESGEKFAFAMLAYCFMPVHVHVLLRGEEDTSDLLRLVQRFKQLTGFHYKSLSGDKLWQQSFFDRVLRHGEDPRDVARYILDNPAADGLPSEHPAYVLRGGVFFRGAGADGAKASSLIWTRKLVPGLRPKRRQP